MKSKANFLSGFYHCCSKKELINKGGFRKTLQRVSPSQCLALAIAFILATVTIQPEILLSTPLEETSHSENRKGHEKLEGREGTKLGRDDLLDSPGGADPLFSLLSHSSPILFHSFSLPGVISTSGRRITPRLPLYILQCRMLIAHS
ncbi:MAG: hypothetical protein ACO3XO_07355 [Bdellovibrionota bacterium]